MAITLGSVSLDEAYTAVREDLEEVGGRNERRIRLTGSIVGENSVAAIHDRLDEILDAASVEDFSAELSLRAGRRLFVRRDAFRREVFGESLMGSFVLELEARDPIEESIALTTLPWSIAASGATLAATSGGSVYAEPSIALVASGNVVNPAFSDGTRTISYSGIVADGETLVLDGAGRRATLEGVDVTPYTSGVFPRISPEGTTLTYTDDATSSHSGTVTVSFRDRWW